MIEKKIKFLEVISRAFVLISIVFLYILWDYSSFFHYNFICFGVKLNHPLLPYIILVLAILFEIIAHWLRKKNNLPVKKSIFSFSSFLLLFFIAWLFFGFLLVSMCACGSIGKAKDALKISDLRQVKIAQEMFYEKNSRFAVSQKELVDAGIFTTALINPTTKKEYTDADGLGLEGGDNNPNTWSVQAILMDYNLEICSREKQKLIFYYCNQTDCGSLNEGEINNIACAMEVKLCPDGSYVGRTGPNCEFAECPTANVDETADWKIYTSPDGFEIKYPPNWRPISIGENGENPGGHFMITSLSAEEEQYYRNELATYDGIGGGFAHINTANGKAILIEFVDTTIFELKKYIGGEQPFFEVSDFKYISQRNLEMYRFRAEYKWEMSLDFDTVYVKKPSTGKYLSLSIERNNGDYEKDIFNKMLSTFKFTK